MSWQTYVDEHLMCGIDGHHLSAAAIVGHDGNVWAKSDSFPQFKPQEITAIMNDFNEPGSLAPTGLFLGPNKYMFIQGEAGSVIRGKKLLQRLADNMTSDPKLSRLGNEYWQLQGSGGVTIKKTNQAMIFGIYEDPMTPGQCNMVVEKLGNYLVDQGL